MQSLNWFAAYTRPRHEKKVEEYAQLFDINTFLPLYHEKHRWRNGVSKELGLPLFPGYIFFHLNLQNWKKAIKIPSVITLVGFGPNMTPIPDHQIEQIRLIVSGFKTEPHPFIRIGEKVRIKFGPLSGLEGIVVRKKGTWRLVITLDFIMRSVSLEIDASDLEQISNVCPKAKGIPVSSFA